MTNGYGSPSLNKKIEQRRWNERTHRQEGWRGKSHGNKVMRRQNKRMARRRYDRMIELDF